MEQCRAAAVGSFGIAFRHAVTEAENGLTLPVLERWQGQSLSLRSFKVSCKVTPNRQSGGGKREQVPGSGTGGNQYWVDVAASSRSSYPNSRRPYNFPSDRREPLQSEESSSTQGSRSRKEAGKVQEGEDPYRESELGRKVYLDELDILTLLDPPRFLRPFDSSTFSHAAFLWKKIGDIPEERRHRLVNLLQPKHIEMMWKIVVSRYENEELFVDDPLSMFKVADPGKPIYWDGKVNGVPWAVGWLSKFQKVFFAGEDGVLYGRVVAGGPLLKGLAGTLCPLYFSVRRCNVVPISNDPCDLAFHYGSGQLHLQGKVPEGFPPPGRNLGPFRNDYVVYLRAVGPGVFVGQAWQLGSDPPKQDLGKFLLIKRHERKAERDSPDLPN